MIRPPPAPEEDSSGGRGRFGGRTGDEADRAATGVAVLRAVAVAGDRGGRPDYQNARALIRIAQRVRDYFLSRIGVP